ncbi:hypothetical protein, partial [Alistipes finegoldii]|uniref:hypothetical protein n=1 Tax=Alistipes finegoldii TaxID=214856 RepID=UPI003AB473EA
MEPTGGQRVSCAAISPVCPVRNVVCLVLRRKTGTPSEKNGAARRGSDGHCRNGFEKVKDNMLKYKLFVKFFRVFFRRKKLQAGIVFHPTLRSNQVHFRQTDYRNFREKTFTIIR